MKSIQLSSIDRLITEFDRGLRTMAGANQAGRANPAAGIADTDLSEAEIRESARLMRVNHAGEVAAQALYQGQALSARAETNREALRRSADEETDHLAWCEERVRELGGHTSYLGPFWYLGALAIGAGAGLAGDRISLGFLAETERQVVEHLDGHLTRLPPGDHRSRAIIAQMRTDEEHHGNIAREAGGAELPDPVRGLMRMASRVMTTLAHRI
ncbi:MAG: 2-polyprenyl-3-methyl-6-methoxy-1,4-benzoquinone monooxygenase [Gammaproteobacteria bacterium]|jgi:ubiquinone biosynthesis monooxygenase Coq7